MIEQKFNQLILTFPTTDSATTFAAFLRSLLQPLSPEEPSLTTGLPGPEISEPVSESFPNQTPIPASPEPGRSRHVILTEERQAQLSRQREQGLTEHQRLLRAHTLLRDGVLPFSKPGQAPQPTGQPSPRQKAQQEGGFADGAKPALRPEADLADLAEARTKQKSQLKPVPRS